MFIDGILPHDDCRTVVLGYNGAAQRRRNGFMPARRGKEYLQSLRDGRALYVRGEKVADVTTHPAFREASRTLAGLFDLQHDPHHSETLTYKSPATGDPVSVSYLMPKSGEDLVRRRRANRLVAEQTYGMISRTPNLLAQIVTQWAMNREIFDALGKKFGDAICGYYEYCREHDVALTHAIVSPQYDRSKGLSAQEDPDLVVGLVDQDWQGIVVRGTRMLATHAHFSNEVVVWPFDRLTEADSRYALWFACPLNAKGVTLISREPYANGRGVFDSPLASRFDEMDAAIIFEDVKIPWDRVFALGNHRFNPMGEGPGRTISLFGAQQISRAIVKAEFMYALASGVADSIGIDGFLHVQQMLGEMLEYLDAMKAMERVYEVDVVARDGKLYPAPGATRGGRGLMPQHLTRMAWILREICGAGQVMTPSAGDFNNAELGPLVRRYFRGKAGVSAVDKVKLMKLAWETTSDQFGSRATIYEYYHSGDPVRLLAGRHLREDRSRYRDILKAAMADMDEDLKTWEK
jgi:4-hydroxyphenylacetate 3-monooxygenase oxygenase component